MPGQKREGTPFKYTDLLSMMRGARDKSLATTFLPGQGGIPAPTQEFLASKRNPFPNALPMPIEALNFQSLAGTLGVMGNELVKKPFQQFFDDRQDRGFFVQKFNERLGDQK
jgi:hypothetical protein